MNEMEKKAERFLKLGTELGELLGRKNKAYGDSFERSVKIIEILYPNGIPIRAYPAFLGMIRMIDKMFRIAQISQDDTYSFSEEEKDAWQDSAGYSILELERITRPHPMTESFVEAKSKFKCRCTICEEYYRGSRIEEGSPCISTKECPGTYKIYKIHNSEEDIYDEENV